MRLNGFMPDQHARYHEDIGVFFTAGFLFPRFRPFFVYIPFLYFFLVYPLRGALYMYICVCMCIYIYIHTPEKGGIENQLLYWNPRPHQIAWPSALKSSSCNLALTAQKVLRQASWNSVGGLRIFNLSSNILFSIYLLHWPKAGLRGNRYPIAANFLLVIPSKLEFFCWNKPVCITTESIKLLAQNTFKIGVL